MKYTAFIFLAFVAAAHGGLFIQDGQEYEYESSITASSGTMDYSAHMAGANYKMKVRVQVSGRSLNVQISDLKMTQYVGKVDSTSNPFAGTSYTPVPGTGDMSFSVSLDGDGKFKSLVHKSGLSPFQKNLIKGWAASLQINSGEIKSGKKAFKSTEQTLHGECDISYTVAGDMLYKNVAHMKDCRNRVYRLVDDWRGHRCDIDWSEPQKREGTDGLYSHANTAMKIEKQGSGYVIKAMQTSSAVVGQFFESEGVSHIAHVNVSSILVNQRSSPGDISVSGGENTNSLAYEFADKDYKWNVDRDLKAKEPFFASGSYFADDQASMKDALKRGLTVQKKILESTAYDADSVQKAHQYGINTLYPAVYGLDYSSLKSLAEELFADKSDSGVMKSNLFNELLGATGTTAAALVVRDLIMENKFDNDRDAARVLSSVPFHIRRPNTQLVREYEQLLNFGGAERLVKMAIPLTFGHLIRITCMRAGNVGSPEQKECFGSFASKYVTNYWNKYKSTSDREEKGLALGVLMNIRFGGQAEKLRALINGEMPGESDEMRSNAIWAAGWDAMVHGGIDYFMPVFANQANDHEVRLSALTMIFYSKPSSTDIARVLTVLKTEKDYEVINYAYALMEKFANSLNPCDEKTGETARYFLKYMKQFSGYETDWGFGVSKTFQRQFHKKKYGYTGTYSYYTIGSHKSTTPLTVGMGIGTNLFHSYNNHMFSVHLRIEGLAKGLIRKFKTMDPTVWKTADLEQILEKEMGIRERPDQPVRVSVTIMLKGAVVIQRFYDEGSAGEDGKLGKFFKTMTGLGDTYSINHQRVINVGSLLYEQPTDIGLPMAYMNGITTMAHLTATIKRGILRGLIYRNVDYDVNLFTQGVNIMMVMNPGRKVSYGIVQDRIYKAHFPRKLVIGLNPSRKEVKISIQRPEKNDPWMMMMHSQTVVTARGHTISGAYNDIKKNCPSCESRVVVSKGPEATKRRVFVDHDNEKFGYAVHGEYFDCEMDVASGNTRGRLLYAFMPYNKNPKTPWTSISMGIRQIQAFLIFFPKAQKCGAMVQWSQSTNNPTKEIEISVRAQIDENGERMFFRGRKWLIRAVIKAKGEPATRSYRVSFSYDFTPGYIQNRLKVMVNRAPVAALGIKPYTICFAYESKFPDFAPEFLGVNMNSDLVTTGKAMVQYGEGTECGQGEGELRLKFKHSTTAEGRKALKDKWYFKQCMEQKNSAAWRGRPANTLPISEPCYMTAWDATSARKYMWNIEFVKLTNRMSNIISKVQTLVKAGMWPYWDVDPDELDVNGSPGPFMNLEVEFKNGDQNLDMSIETSQGKSEFKDYPLKLDWSKRLRNLKFTKTIKRLIDYKIISPCIATSESIRTNDNVTYSYQPNSCWTLVSAHCGPTPNFAVFSKKVGGSKPLAAKAYFGGHSIEFVPSGSSVNVLINGSPVTLQDQKEHEHKENNQEIFKVFRWGSTYNVYSFLRMWMAYDGSFLEVMPAPSTRGQHCGLCGNFNRNKFDEWTGKTENAVTSAADMVNEWKWKC